MNLVKCDIHPIIFFYKTYIIFHIYLLSTHIFVKIWLAKKKLAYLTPLPHLDHSTLIFSPIMKEIYMHWHKLSSQPIMSSQMGQSLSLWALHSSLYNICFDVYIKKENFLMHPMCFLTTMQKYINAPRFRRCISWRTKYWVNVKIF